METSDWILLGLIIVANIFWTIVIRTFPSLLGQGILKKVQHTYDKELEVLRGKIRLDNDQQLALMKANLETVNSDIKSSIALLSATHADWKRKKIESIESMWTSMLEVEREFADLMFCEWCVLSEELDKSVKQRNSNDKTFKKLRQYENDVDVVRMHSRVKECGAEILFVSIRLWSIYNAFRRVHFRFGYLAHRSLKEKKYRDWKNDTFMFANILDGVVDVETLENAKGQKFGGLTSIVNRLKAEFIHEARGSAIGSDEIVQSVAEVASSLRRDVKSRSIGI